MSKRPKFVIFDGHALVHRGYHAIPYLTTKDGTPTNAVFGFATMMLLALRELKPDYVAVAWDAPGPTFRHKQFKDYKGTRQKADQELYDQLPITKDLIEAFNIPLIEQVGYEADDIIGSLAEKYRAQADVVIVTGDMDELQLVSDRVSVYTMRKGFTDTVIFDPKMVHEKYGVTPEEFVVYKALKGDSSDNIPGVAGIGDKTATELVAKYQSLDNIYKNLDNIRPAVVKKLEAGRESAYLSLDLSRIVRDMKLDFDLKRATTHDFDRQKVYDLFQKLEFKSLLAKLPTPPGGKGLVETETNSEKLERSHLVSANYKIVQTEADLKKLVELLSKAKVISFDTETTDTDVIKADLVGLSFAVHEGEAYYVPVGHVQTKPDDIDFVLMAQDAPVDLAGGQLPLELVIKALKPILEDPKIGKVGHNIKYDYQIMNRAGVKLTPIVFDTMVAAFLINPIGRAQSLTELAYSDLGIRMIEITELIGSKGKNQLHFGQTDVSQAGQYAAEDADIALRLYHKLQADLKKLGKLTEVAKTFEWPLIEVLGDMELTGVTLNVKFLAKFAKQIDGDIDKCQKAIWKLAGQPFNINSPGQLQEILFNTLKIETAGLKKTKTGYSTAASELEKLRGVHDIIEHLFEYRELTKLKSTYVDALPNAVAKDGKIHTSYNQTIAQTGRLNSTNPNLQNIPVRTVLGREIRKAFVADEGNVLVSADYNQIELRLAAALADDKPMIKTFREHLDIHTATAAEMFGIKPEEVTPQQRYGAKTINFGVLYGMSPHGLSVAAKLDYDQAKEFIDRYFNLRKGVADYIERIKKLAHRQQFTETYFGRRRPCPDVKSNNFVIRSAAERAAVNMPLQGTAADMIKLAMIRIHKVLPNGAGIILQIHDELIVECKKSQAKEVGEIMSKEMIGVHKFAVPIEVGLKVGTSWGELE
ncbi:DNA polymerase I [Candidatus Saccharibacteria bacterium]|nr:DNA polymerase I [Candidatus Saccharibacteria bacterium]